MMEEKYNLVNIEEKEFRNGKEQMLVYTEIINKNKEEGIKLLIEFIELSFVLTTTSMFFGVKNIISSQITVLNARVYVVEHSVEILMQLNKDKEDLKQFIDRKFEDST